MIRLSLIVAALLFSFYCLFINTHLSMGASQNQWQENIIKAQKYIYNNTSSSNDVMVGTSLSNKLIMDSIPGFINLSFSGESIYDGLNIILLKDKLPRSVYIEMNFAFKSQNEEFISSVSNPVLLKVKKHLYALREDKQPLAIFGDFTNTFFVKNMILKTKNSFFARQNVFMSSNQSVLGEMIKLQQQKYILEPDTMLVTSCLKKLHPLINRLKKQNVNVVFFEMPVNEQLINMPMAKKVRELFLKEFPIETNNYIFSPKNIADYQTTDGIHLTKSEILTYRSYFKEEIKKYTR